MKLGATATKTALLAITGLILSLAPSRAADPVVVADPVSGDLFIGFRATANLGSTKSYLVKIGLDTQFTQAPAGTSQNVAIPGSIVEDLRATYGEDWNNRPDLFWGIFGYRPNSGSPIVYGSRERSSPNTGSSPWAELTLQNRTSTFNQISPVLVGIGGYRGQTSTSNSTVAILQPNSASASSYNTQVGTPSTSDFGSVSEWSSIEGSFANGEGRTVLDLFRVAGSGVTRVGSFSINQSGVVHFSNVIPSNFDPNADSDGDGVTNGNEAIAGTNPSDGADFFKVTTVARANDGVHVDFNTVAARNYQIEYSETLLAGSWIPVGSYTASSGGTYQFLDVDLARRAKAKGFYRVRVSQ